MQFAFSEDQLWLKTTARRFCQDNAALGEFKPGKVTCYRPELWAQIAEELGWTALIVPEEYGGAGLGFVELAALTEEMGRSLLPSPFFSTVCLGTNAILNAANKAQKQAHLPMIIAGELTTCLAYAENDECGRPETIEMKAKRVSDTYRLSGTKRFVIDGHTADLIIVAAKAEDTKQLELFAVPCDTPGLKRTQRPNMDPTRCLADIEFENLDLPASMKLGNGQNDPDILQHILNSAAVALAAEQVGGAARCLEMAVDYAKTRHQFGQPIGSFQAIKHKCADMLLRVESARSAAYYAAWAVDNATSDLPTAASLAKVYCSEAYFECASENIQIHGGIGFTWEHDAHYFFKRAQADEIFLGTPSHHREVIAKELEL
jgi:alkylation response protein AidB-like acyl-CoA dehydrogenase